MLNYGCGDVGKSKGAKLGEDLIDWVNGSDSKEEQGEFILAILNGHRTLQQNLMKVNLKLIEAWSKSTYDGRNEATVRMCKKIMTAIGEDKYLPLI